MYRITAISFSILLNCCICYAGNNKELPSATTETPPRKAGIPMSPSLEKDVSQLIANIKTIACPELTTPAELTRTAKERYYTLPKPLEQEKDSFACNPFCSTDNQNSDFITTAQPRYDDIPCVRETVALFNNTPVFHANNVVINGRHYLVTQAPKQKTTTNFWALVCASQAYVSVDLTSEDDRAMNKSCNFIPEAGQTTCYEKETGTLDGFRVSIANTGETCFSFSPTASDDSSETTIIVSHLTLDSKHHTHIRVTDWPDMTTLPPTMLALLTAIIRLYSSDPEIPVQINCSAGMGRAGTVVVTDVLMNVTEQQADTHEPDSGLPSPVTDLDDIITQLRQQRGNHCIIKPEQYAALAMLEKNIQTIKQVLNTPNTL